MYPIFKFLNLLVRLFSRPTIEFMKTIHYKQVHPESHFSGFLIRLGNFQYRFKVYVDQRVRNIRTDPEMFSPLLVKDIALEKGIHFFYESLFYIVVIGAATFETWHIIETNKEENLKNKETLAYLNSELDKMIESADALIEEDTRKELLFEKNLVDASEVLKAMLDSTDAILAREKKLYAYMRESQKSQENIAKELERLQKKYKIKPSMSISQWFSHITSRSTKSSSEDSKPEG